MTVNEKGLEAATVAYLAHRGEQPRRVVKGGSELWETHRDAVRAAIEAYLRASSNDAEPRDLEKPMLVFQYRNWRNEVAERHVIPQRVWWGSTEWHPHGCWLLSAYDLDRQAIRDFDIRGINAPELFGKIEATHPSTGGEGGVHKLLNDIYDFLGGVDGAVELRARILSAIEPVAASPGVGDAIALVDDDFDEPGTEFLKHASPEPSPASEDVREPDFAYTPHDWEYTAEWSERGLLTDELPYGEIEEVATLFCGPTKWAAHVATTYDDAGDPDQTEVLWFDSEEDAKRALSSKQRSEKE